MKRVIIVNRDRVYSNFIGEYINSLGYKVVSHIDSIESLLKLDIVDIFAAIVDISVETKDDGIEFAKLIKSINNEIKIILTINRYSSKLEKLLSEIEPSRVLLKPLNRNELRVVLKMLR